MPREAREALAAILDGAPRGAAARRRRGPGVDVLGRLLGVAALRRARRQRELSTLRDHRNAVRRYLLPGLGADTPVASITIEDIDAFRERSWERPPVAPLDPEDARAAPRHRQAREAQEWIAANPAEDGERATVARSGDFSVLTTEEVEALKPLDFTHSRPRASTSCSGNTGWLLARL
jgi:hypothetical protein